MKLKDKYKGDIVLFEIEQAIMYGVLRTRVEHGIVSPSKEEVEQIYNDFLNLENPFANAKQEPNLVRNQN